MVFKKGSIEGEFQRELDQIDLEGPVYAISSDNVGTVALGGEEKKAQLYEFRTLANGTCQFVEGSQELAMCFESVVTKLEYCGGGAKLLGVSQDSYVKLMDVETKKVTSFE